MAVLSGSDTVATISQSTGCYGLNLATNRSFISPPLAVVFLFVLVSLLHANITAASLYKHTHTRAFFLTHSAEISVGDAAFVPIEVEG